MARNPLESRIRALIKKVTDGTHRDPVDRQALLLALERAGKILHDIEVVITNLEVHILTPEMPNEGDQK